MDAPIRRRPPGLLSQLRVGASALVQRLLGVGVQAYGKGGDAVNPSYPVERSEQAFLSNPWVWACYHAICSDLAGLPLVAETGVGVDRVQSPDHWLIQLLERPHPKVSGRRFREQVVADDLGGNAYIRAWRGTDGRPFQLGRIPPGVIQPIVADDGEEVGWRIQGRPDLAWADVLHISDISLSSSLDLVMGSSPIQPLALGLQVDRDARRQAGRSAKRGQLEMILSPSTDGMVLGEDRVNGIVSGWTDSRERGDGLYVVNTGMTATATTLTARDGEFLGISDRLRAEVLATFGVPETRVGSPAANYGTAREQSRIYWQTLQARAARIDDELSRLAEPGTRIRHSFSGVDALQVAQTERLGRVVTLVDLGMDVNQALRYEGFFDAPVVTAPPQPQSAPASPPPVDQPHAKAAVAAVLRTAAGVLAQGDTADQVEPVVRSLLRSTLMHAGATRDRADLVASEAAAVCVESVRAADEGDAPVDLRAFGADHATRIVRLAGLEAA